LWKIFFDLAKAKLSFRQAGKCYNNFKDSDYEARGLREAGCNYVVTYTFLLPPKEQGCGRASCFSGCIQDNFSSDQSGPGRVLII